MKLNRLFASTLLCLGAAAPLAPAQEAPKGITLRLVERGFDAPLYFINDPGGRNFVVEQRGRVWLLDKDMHKGKTPYLDIVDRVHMEGECGLLSIAFHPKFAENGRLFVDYSTKDPKLRSVIAEFKCDPNADHVDPATEKELLTYNKPQSNHNGGLALFGPDGYLYIGAGDGGGGGDSGSGHVKGGNGQSLQTMLGKILRIDVDHPGGDKPYGIPKDNPSNAGLNCLPEIYSYGMRNPWRFSFDRKTGQLFCGDVGQNTWEEVDLITNGGNYGWHIREGLHEYAKQSTTDKLIDPIAEYKHNVGLSITGGYVYRGKAFPELQGIYFYGDYSTGRIWGLRYENDKVTWQGELPVTANGRTGPNQFSPSSFGEDAGGEIYTTDYARGLLYQLTPTK